MMNVQELATLAELDLNVKIVLLDNAALGMVRQQQELFYAGRYTASKFLAAVNWFAIAAAFGIPAHDLGNEPDAGRALARALRTPGPQLIRIAIDEAAHVMPMVPPGGANTHSARRAHAGRASGGPRRRRNGAGINSRMGQEIERKFLVTGDGWRATARTIRITQGYLTRDKERWCGFAPRTRPPSSPSRAPRAASRAPSSNTPFPRRRGAHAARVVPDAAHRQDTLRGRYRGSHLEIDVFEAPQPGLIIAELELPSADHPFARPDWLGAEVTGDPRFYNQNMLDGATTPS